MRYQPLLAAACLLWVMMILGCESTSLRREVHPVIGTIQRDDSKFHDLVGREAVIEKLADGFAWSEGPVWIARENSLLFSDVKKNVVNRWQEGKGVVTFLSPSGYTGTEPPSIEPGSNGLTLDPQGRLVLCEHGDRRVARLEKDGSQTTLADRFEGKRFNSPNDLVYKSNGDLYFTDPPYGLNGKNDNPKKELGFNGVYRLSKDGKLTLLTKELTFPNGLAFSPNEKTLYVAVSDPNHAVWMAFDVKSDGTLGSGRVFYDATSMVNGHKGLPDGMKIDSAGNLFATGPGGVWVFSPDGKHLGTIDPGEATANCAWGEDGHTLYMTSDMNLCRIRLKTKGKVLSAAQLPSKAG
jgi:gluconolactonase